MPKLRLSSGDHDTPSEGKDSIPFPAEQSGSATGEPGSQEAPAAGERSTADVLLAFEQVSRRMEDLARELGCMGFFDDDDRPRAA